MEYIFSLQHLSWLDDNMPEKDKKEEEEKLKRIQDQDESDSEDVSMIKVWWMNKIGKGLNWVLIRNSFCTTISKSQCKILKSKMCNLFMGREFLSLPGKSFRNHFQNDGAVIYSILV